MSVLVECFIRMFYHLGNVNKCRLFLNPRFWWSVRVRYGCIVCLSLILNFRRGRPVFPTSLLKRLNHVAESINQRRALGKNGDAITEAPQNSYRILEFECQGEGADETRKPFKAEVELWDCSGNKKYAHALYD